MKKGRPKQYDDATIITLYINRSDLIKINEYCEKNGIVRNKFFIKNSLDKLDKLK